MKLQLGHKYTSIIKTRLYVHTQLYLLVLCEHIFSILLKNNRCNLHKRLLIPTFTLTLEFR